MLRLEAVNSLSTPRERILIFVHERKPVFKEAALEGVRTCWTCSKVSLLCLLSPVPGECICVCLYQSRTCGTLQQIQNVLRKESFRVLKLNIFAATTHRTTHSNLLRPRSKGLGACLHVFGLNTRHFGFYR